MVNEISASKLSSSKSIKKSKKRTGAEVKPKLTKFLFDGVIYCVNDYLMLRETNKTTVVAKLLKVVPEVLQKNGNVLPMLKVRFFYSKKDILVLA